MGTRLLKIILLSLLGFSSLEALEIPKFLRGEGQERELAHISTLHNPVLVTLVTSLTSLSELCYTLNSMMYASGAPDASVLVFYDIASNNLLSGQKNALKACSERNLFFETVDFSQFAPGFTPRVGRDYTFEQSQRFYASGMWNEPALDPYDVILRFSDDSCLSYNSTVLPYMDDHHVYHGHNVPGAYEIARKYSLNFYQKAFDYISSIGAHPLDKTMWSNVVLTHTDYYTLPVMNSGFEAVRKSFIKRQDVATWLHYLTDLPPYV